MVTGTHASRANDQAAGLLAALRELPEVQVAVAYLGGAWLAYQVADLLVFALDIPEVVLRAFLGLLAVGAVLAALLGRWLKLTLVAVRRGLLEAERDIRGVPDLLEPLLIRAAGTVSRRTTVLALAGASVAFCVLFIFLFSTWVAAHERQVVDDRITLVVFPFGASGRETEGLGPGVAELLSATLDGTPGLRVVDPSSLWRNLPLDGNAPRAPALEVALALGREAGARRLVVGSLISTGSRLEISAGVHDLQQPDAEGVPLRVSAHQDSLGTAVEGLAIDVVATVWQREQLPTVPSLDRSITRSADALKAYLEAMGALRQGRLEVARESAERAVAIDSTFALAHLTRLAVETDILFAQAMPFTGLRPIVEAAARHSMRLTPRNRMRIDAYRALDATDGATAAFLFERILSIDSLDVDALAGLASTYLVSGWQLEAAPEEVSARYRRLLRADPRNTGALATLARIDLWRGDLDGAAAWVGTLADADSLGAYARGTVGSYQILSAPEQSTDSLLSAWARQDVAVALTVLRDLRVARPDLAERFVDNLSADSMPTFHRRIGQGARPQIWMARGRLSGVDSVLATGTLETLRRELAVFRVTAAMAGVADSASAAQAAADLAAATPLASLADRPQSEAAWSPAWAIGAYHAVFGDTTEARRWGNALGALPPGDADVREWPSSLFADIQARLAMRRGDLAAAEEWARRAYDLWTVHGFNVLESHPEPAMRFHLASVLSALGETGPAEWLYRSLCPPHTWMGFYSARASHELGGLLEAQGRSEEARSAYQAAARLWEGGDAGVVGSWLLAAREGVTRLTR